MHHPVVLVMVRLLNGGKCPGHFPMGRMRQMMRSIRTVNFIHYFLFFSFCVCHTFFEPETIIVVKARTNNKENNYLQKSRGDVLKGDAV